MKYFLDSGSLAIEIESKGAELQRLYHKQTKIEHLWSGDAAYWGKYSPVLFPVVGTLKHNTYLYEGNEYHLPRHGFAREKEFSVTQQTNDQITLALHADENTRQVYPFQFSLELCYRLHHHSMTCSYTVKNTGKEAMPFSLGAHPAFAVPFLPGTCFEDHYLEFDKDTSITRWKLNSAGLISKETAQIELQHKKLYLRHDLFADDAIVVKDLKSGSIQLACLKSKHGFDLLFSNFPFFGIWSAKNAPFVCLEPWQGIADAENHQQDIFKKEGIKILQPGQSWDAYWEVAVF